MSNSFKDLIVWQKSMELVKAIYLITHQLPKTEQYSLASQLCRAAISIPSNIAEGSKRGTKKDFLQFLRIASGSAAEVETQLILVGSLYSQIDQVNASDLLQEVQRMLTNLMRSMH